MTVAKRKPVKRVRRGIALHHVANIADHGVRIGNLEEDFVEHSKNVEKHLETMQNDIAAIKNIISMTKGGWRVLLYLGTVGLGVLAIIKFIWEASRKQ